MDQAVLQVAIEDLEKKRVELSEQQVKIKKAIGALQEICEHEFGSGDHSYNTCEYCGIEQKV